MISPRRFSAPNTPWATCGCPEKLQSHIQLEYYDAGHMMYLREQDLAHE